MSLEITVRWKKEKKAYGTCVAPFREQMLISWGFQWEKRSRRAQKTYLVK
jgi:hypothetical protein